ncbi:MAG: hypothetical protein QOF51_3815, partial [Chloroflexota bacterium]|nr:hypothetical protein [Chloroflexota bacterium]
MGAMRIRILLVVALVVALAGGGVFAFSQLAHPTTGFALVDESTLVVLRGRVELQTAGRSDFAQVTNDTPLHVGDRVRTGPDGLAVITYFDGSTTELEPDSAIQLNRLDRLLGGGKTISFSQEAGQSWNRVERLADAQSRFETTTQAATAFVQGTEFQVKVDPITKKMTVDAVTDSVIVQALVNGQIVQVQLDPGFETTVTPDQPPTQPVPSPPAAFALRIDVVGPVAPWMTDSRNRSVGFQPDMDTYASQIPGAHYTAGGGRQSLSLPDPADSYTLVLKAQGDGGPYTVTVTSLVSGQEVAARTFGLAAPLAATSLGGAAQRGQRQQGSLKVNAANRTTTLVGFTPLNGSAPGNGAFATSATGGGAVPPTTTSTATVRPSDTPTAAATA